MISPPEIRIPPGEISLVGNNADQHRDNTGTENKSHGYA